jgi:hypothetical protein
MSKNNMPFLTMDQFLKLNLLIIFSFLGTFLITRQLAWDINSIKLALFFEITGLSIFIMRNLLARYTGIMITLPFYGMGYMKRDDIYIKKYKLKHKHNGSLKTFTDTVLGILIWLLSIILAAVAIQYVHINL